MLLDDNIYNIILKLPLQDLPSFYWVNKDYQRVLEQSRTLNTLYDRYLTEEYKNEVIEINNDPNIFDQKSFQEFLDLYREQFAWQTGVPIDILDFMNKTGITDIKFATKTVAMIFFVLDKYLNIIQREFQNNLDENNKLPPINDNKVFTVDDVNYKINNKYYLARDFIRKLNEMNQVKEIYSFNDIIKLLVSEMSSTFVFKRRHTIRYSTDEQAVKLLNQYLNRLLPIILDYSNDSFKYAIVSIFVSTSIFIDLNMVILDLTKRLNL